MTIKDVKNISDYIINNYGLLLLLPLLLCINYFPMVFVVIQIMAISSNTETKIITKVVVILSKLHTVINTFISGITTSAICITHRMMFQPSMHTFFSLYLYVLNYACCTVILSTVVSDGCIVSVSTARSNRCSISVRCLIPPF